MRFWLFIAAVGGALGVAMAALGAHGVALNASDARGFAAANMVHMWHALATVAVVAVASRPSASASPLRMSLLNAACALFTAGTLLFAGTLYVRTLMGVTPLPFAMPAGGIGLIAGWLALAAAALIPRR